MAPEDKHQPANTTDGTSGKPAGAASLHSQIGMISVDEAVRRDQERKRLARERDEALGWPDPPPGRTSRRRR